MNNVMGSFLYLLINLKKLAGLGQSYNSPLRSRFLRMSRNAPPKDGLGAALRDIPKKNVCKGDQVKAGVMEALEM